jgi:hypothetical protein
MVSASRRLLHAGQTSSREKKLKSLRFTYGLVKIFGPERRNRFRPFTADAPGAWLKYLRTPMIPIDNFNAIHYHG